MTFLTKIRFKTDSAAQAFAFERHGEQAHGCLTIRDHLEDVVRHVRIHYDPHVNISEMGEIVSAAWLHDILEDTNTMAEEIGDRFGFRVEELVCLLTDKAGASRMERHLKTYHAIRQDPDAVLIKLCDRRHNQARSLEHGEHWMAMYAQEYNYFKFALWTPHRYKHLWAELDKQHEEMKKKLTW